MAWWVMGIVFAILAWMVMTSLGWVLFITSILLGLILLLFSFPDSQELVQKETCSQDIIRVTTGQQQGSSSLLYKEGDGWSEDQGLSQETAIARLKRENAKLNIHFPVSSSEMVQEWQAVISPSQLPCTPHTTYYSNLFVLKTTVAINEQQAEIAFSKDDELTLNCRYPSTKCLTLNYHTISVELEGIFRKYGVNHVNNCWCESTLYFQVSFHSQESVWNFLHSQKEMEIELSTLLSKHLPVSEKESCSCLVCEVETELFLIIVDAQKKNAWVEAVSKSNYSTCLAIWKESAVFEFGSLFRTHQFGPRRDLVNDPLTLVQLLSELADVVEWFSLGIYLEVPEPELLKIEADDRGPNQGRTERCKTALFNWWLKNGEISWSAVVKALVKIKMAGLAQKIALKYGTSMLQASELAQPSVAELPATTQEDQQKETELATAASSLDAEMRKKVSLGKRHAQETQLLAESSSKIRRLTIEQDEGMRELEKKEQELNLYIRLQQELTTQKDIEHLKVKIARKKEKIKQLKAQLDRVEKELSQAREESKQQRERIQQITVKLAGQCEKTRNLERTVAKLKRERKEKDKQMKLTVARNQHFISKLHASTDREVKSLKQEIKEKDSTIRELSRQLEVKEAEEKELEEGQLVAEISDLRAKLEEAEDGKMRAEEELKDLQDEDNKPESVSLYANNLIITPDFSKYSNKAPMETETSFAAREIEPGCKKISKPGEHPVIYQLPLKVVKKRGNLSWCTIGEPVCSSNVIPHKVLMLVGAIGAGKSTLINGITNYIQGIRWEDDYRFKLISEEEDKSQACSQTECITSYTFHHTKVSPLPFTLTVVDTPGFSDTECLERDKKISTQIKEFFSIRNVEGIDQLNGIGFVVQASLPQLTSTQRHIFDAILSIFGKDIGSNIFLMTTFADGQTSPVLEAIRVAGIPYKSYFKFNNSALFADKSAENEIFWEMDIKGFEKFFKVFAKVETRLTREVLAERDQLEIAIQGLQSKIRAGLSKIDELRYGKSRH